MRSIRVDAALTLSLVQRFVYIRAKAKEMSTQMASQRIQLNVLGCIYNRAKAKTKAIFFFDLCHCCSHCSINTQIGNNATDRKRRHFSFRSSINAPLH